MYLDARNFTIQNYRVNYILLKIKANIYNKDAPKQTEITHHFKQKDYTQQVYSALVRKIIEDDSVKG